MIKLALAGGLRVGKTEAENYLVDKFDCSPFDFSDALKDDFHLEFKNIRREPKPRKGYQLYGQLMRYVHGENYWVDKCFYRVETETHLEECRSIIHDDTFYFRPLITGVRQPNEFQRLREEGYFIIRVSAPKELQIKRSLEAGDDFKEEDLLHETEVTLMNEEVHYDILNDGTIKDLHRTIDAVMLDIYTKVYKEEN
ncbi:desphospho-CoA kinase [Bacillus phage vB_BanH_JarJar]|nr:desphospho-CoA kinase [Bacillus phage vB_BanH_JarJar]UGO50349.1 desphospho-CoA kinase [Bacillus phage vB_BanH_RonSwanson]